MSEKEKSTGHPLCPICGGRHRLGGPHAWDERPAATPTRKIVEAAEKVKEIARAAGSSNGRTAAFEAVNAGSIPAPATKRRGRPPTGFDKTAYDREYSRQRRQKAKQK